MRLFLSGPATLCGACGTSRSVQERLQEPITSMKYLNSEEQNLTPTHRSSFEAPASDPLGVHRLLKHFTYIGSSRTSRTVKPLSWIISCHVTHSFS